MRRIITLTGHQYCGKVSVAIKLSSNSDMELIYPVTDKPVPPYQSHYDRDEYAHISKERMDELLETEELLCMTTIHRYRYCFFKFQLKADYSIMIVDDDALVQVRNNHDDVYAIKVWSDNEKKSDRVGQLPNSEFDEVFHYKVDDISELEWRIGYDFD